MEGYFSFSDGDIPRLFRRLELLTGKSQQKMLRERAGALSRYLASATQPMISAEESANLSAVASFRTGKDTKVGMGDSKHAKDLGQAAVKRDISRVYSPPSATYRAIREEHGNKQARAFYKLLSDGKLAAVTNFLVSLGMDAARLQIVQWDDGSRHQQRRNRRGRVSKGNRPAIVTDTASLEAYIKKIVKRVGWAKSGWITAGREIPGSKGFTGLPAWFRLPAPGRGIDRTGNEENRHVILENHVKYIGELLEPRYLDRAQTAFEESLIKELEIVTEKIQRELPELVAAA